MAKEVKKSTTELVMDMQGLVGSALQEAERLDEKGVKVAATKVRGFMQEVRNLAKVIRETALEKQKSL